MDKVSEYIGYFGQAVVWLIDLLYFIIVTLYIYIYNTHSMILQYRRYTQPVKGLFVTLNMEPIYIHAIGYMVKYKTKVHICSRV